MKEDIEEKIKQMSKGRFGVHGGQYIPETLMNAVTEVEKAYFKVSRARAGWLVITACTPALAKRFMRSGSSTVHGLA